MAFTKRSQPARDAILAAARQQFASDGYERTTIRSVASAASVDPSMVMRYYQSKESLLGAAVDIDLQLPDLTGVPLEQVAAILARHFVDRWEGELADEAIMVLLRSAVTHAAAAERMRAVFGQQVVGLVRSLTDDAADSDVRAGMISSQLLGLALTRYILRLPPVVAVDADTLVRVLTPVLNHFLTQPLDTTNPPSTPPGPPAPPHPTGDQEAEWSEMPGNARFGGPTTS